MYSRVVTAPLSYNSIFGCQYSSQHRLPGLSLRINKINKQSSSLAASNLLRVHTNSQSDEKLGIVSISLCLLFPFYTY